MWTTLSHKGSQPTVATEEREPGTTWRAQLNPFKNQQPRYKNWIGVYHKEYSTAFT